MSFRVRRFFLVVAGLVVAGSAAAASSTLTAVKADAAPKLDGKADDAAWAGANAVSVPLRDGANHTNGRSKVSIKAAYSGDRLYMLVEWDDPTQSFRRAPYVKQPDGSWTKMKDPNDKGGDNNVYYEDKFAMIWSIGNSIKDFEKKGCDLLCHEGEKPKPYGNKYTFDAGEIGDIWHMKTVRGGMSIGQIDDQYVDSTRYDAEKSPEAGRKGDPKTGGGYSDIKLVNGKPEFMSKDAKPANKGGTYWLKAEDKVAFDDSKFVAGDEVASIMVAPFQGDRGDISGAGAWANGKWTYELSRKLVTGSKFDVQFDNRDASYPFGFAAFDNAQVRHAWHRDAIILKFAK